MTPSSKSNSHNSNSQSPASSIATCSSMSTEKRFELMNKFHYGNSTLNLANPNDESTTDSNEETFNLPEYKLTQMESFVNPILQRPEELDPNTLERSNYKNDGRRYYVNPKVSVGPVCEVCKKAGHRYDECPFKRRCQMCGSEDHYSIDCYYSITCYRCLGYGHYINECTNKQNPRCTLCDSTLHSKERCPTLWRVYKLKDPRDKTSQNHNNNQKERKYCYNCAAKTHYGDDCPLLRRKQESAFSSYPIMSEMSKDGSLAHSTNKSGYGRTHNNNHAKDNGQAHKKHKGAFGDQKENTENGRKHKNSRKEKHRPSREDYSPVLEEWDTDKRHKRDNSRKVKSNERAK